MERQDLLGPFVKTIYIRADIVETHVILGFICLGLEENSFIVTAYITLMFLGPRQCRIVNNIGIYQR